MSARAQVRGERGYGLLSHDVGLNEIVRVELEVKMADNKKAKEFHYHPIGMVVEFL